jgi:glutaredoxin 3
MRVPPGNPPLRSMPQGPIFGPIMRVEVYTTRVCPYCVSAKSLLKKRDIPYTEIDVSGDHDKRVWLAKTSGQKTVPQIFIDGQPVGGFTELAALDKSGELAARLSAPAP